VVDENDNDSVEGIMFTKEQVKIKKIILISSKQHTSYFTRIFNFQAVIMTGTFTNTYEPGKLNRMGLWFKPWFYKVRSD
jgi:hypothetical protein